MLPNTVDSLEDLNKVFSSEESCVNYLLQLRWNGNIESPFIPHSKVYVCQNNRFRCSRSKKYFNVKTNTIFHNSRIPLLKWFSAIYIITKENPSITSVELGQRISITQKTAWYMIQRIRAYFDIKKSVRSRPAKVIKSSILAPTDESSRKNMSDWLRTFSIEK